MSASARLFFFCGKMAAGKSTLARELAARENAVLFSEDYFLETLYPGGIADIAAYVSCSTRIRNELAPLICALLTEGISVVLDFAGNTKNQRAWFRELIQPSNAAHELHYLVASDDLYKSRLRHRSKDLPADARWTSDAEFEAITAHFKPPTDDEGLNVVRHDCEE